MIGENQVPVLLVTFYFRIVHPTTNQTLSIKDSVFRVGVECILSGITDTGEVHDQRDNPATRTTKGSQSFFIGEGDPRRSDTMTLVISNDLNSSATLNTAHVSRLELPTHRKQEIAHPTQE